jgi:hypothetical protein
MDELIAKLEAAAEGSRELDREISVTVFSPDSKEAHSVGFYTELIDAALTLVPEGYDWELTSFPTVRAELWQREDDRRDGPQIASSPALALCIAALKARGDG